MSEERKQWPADAVGASTRPPDKPLAPPPAVLNSDADHRLALFGSLLLSVWTGQVRIPALQAMERIIRASASAAPQGRLGLFVIVEPGSTPPDRAAREELSRIRRACPIALTALVYDGSGFHAALVRAITTSLNLLERAETRTHVFAEVAAAAQWVQTRAPEYGDARAIEAAIRALRALTK